MDASSVFEHKQSQTDLKTKSSSLAESSSVAAWQSSSLAALEDVYGARTLQAPAHTKRRAQATKMRQGF